MLSAVIPKNPAERLHIELFPSDPALCCLFDQERVNLIGAVQQLKIHGLRQRSWSARLTEAFGGCAAISRMLN